MLTRIEVDGFKSFDELGVDLQPFSVIVGANASGKSNLFDLLRFLSKLAQTDVISAMRDIRGEPIELFRQVGENFSEKMKIAAEVLLNPVVTDQFGQQKLITQTRIRYEIDLVRRTDPSTKQERVFVERELAVPIRRDEDRLMQLDYRPNRLFLKRYVRRQRVPVFLDTKKDGEAVYLCLHQEGKQGRTRNLPAERAAASALSSVTTADDFPHLYALRKELASVQYLQLNPAAERSGSDVFAGDELAPDGSNIATVLARLESETSSELRPRGAINDVIADLAALIPGVTSLRVERNERKREYQIHISLRDGQTFTSRVVSDGTLRVLALLTLLNDPRRSGIVCFEEPENGIHEGRLKPLIEKLRRSCADFEMSEYAPAGSLFQIIMNTHSPLVMKCLHDNEIIVSDVVTVHKSGVASRRSRMRTGVKSQNDLFDPDKNLSRSEINALLSREHGATA